MNIRLERRSPACVDVDREVDSFRVTLELGRHAQRSLKACAARRGVGQVDHAVALRISVADVFADMDVDAKNGPPANDSAPSLKTRTEPSEHETAMATKCH